MEISDKNVVSIHFSLTNDEGEVIDSSEGNDPLVYMHGTNSLIAGLERELSGKTAGDKIQVSIQPEDAYGQINPDLIQVVPRSAFQGVDEIKPGMQFEAKNPEGHSQLIIIEDVTDTEVKVNGNHPLAGQVLHFDVTVEEVREATEEELNHGHAHFPGQHDH